VYERQKKERKRRPERDTSHRGLSQVYTRYLIENAIDSSFLLIYISSYIQHIENDDVNDDMNNEMKKVNLSRVYI